MKKNLAINKIFSKMELPQTQSNSQSVQLKGNIMTSDGFQKGIISFVDGKIAAIDDNAAHECDDVIDVGNHYIIPGFIDLHMHGIHTHLVDQGIEHLQKISVDILQYGVTGFLPTLYPRPAAEHVAFVKEIAQIQPQGASVLGFHLEGPFLKLTGSLSQNAISKVAELSRAQALIEACKPFKAVFSISPDIEGIADIIPVMAAGNTPVFITHTAANVEQTLVAIKAGAKHATHFYDVYPCPPVTEPGVRPCGAVEAILASEEVSVDFILDGVHVDPIAVKMALACKRGGPGKVCLITDSNVGAGLEPGKFEFGESGEIYFEYKGAPARMTKDNGLAGSGLTMNQAVRNAIKFLGLSLFEALTLASTNPAHVLNIENSKGLLNIGYDADLLIIDEDVNIKQAWVAGCLKLDKLSVTCPQLI
ncbi:MAG: N-acetylglucosamine-6-phosphate deacetylase [Sphingobacteriales bacterium 41-5]|nr:MAG: N-acetylglucosamine-6-phosphate deacetylase [Sphingobacteriales bacterium 41-5]